MPTVVEGRLRFDFHEDWTASQFDKWSFYRNQFQSICGGTKAVDILAIEPRTTLWMIEVKDYRRHRRAKIIDLAEEVALKAKDSLSAIVAASANANDRREREIAAAALKCRQLRVVLHLEQPVKQSKLFPRAIDPAKVQQRLKQLVKAIDPHPQVVSIGGNNRYAWSASIDFRAVN